MLKLTWRHGNKISGGHCVLVDLSFPWPALHHGRNCARRWAKALKRERETRLDFGPYAVSWPMQAAVEEHDAPVLLHIWPVQSQAEPRQWHDDALDQGWRPVIADLAHRIAAEVKCEVRVVWMPGGAPFRKFPRRPPGLEHIRGFLGWKKGQHEPDRRAIQRMAQQGLMSGSLATTWQLPGVTGGSDGSFPVQPVR